MTYTRNRFSWLTPLLALALAGAAIATPPLAQGGPMVVSGMTPTSGPSGIEIVIRGENFGATQGSKLVAINLGGVNLMQVRRWSNTEIRAVVPNLPVGEYTVVLYHDSTYRTFAGWRASPKFRIIPRGTPGPRLDDRRDVPSPPRLGECEPVAREVNLLRNPDFDEMHRSGPTTSRRATGGAGDSAAEHWWLFVNGDGIIKTAWMNTDRPGATGKMLFVSTQNNASGVLQQFLAKDTGPRRVAFAVWVKVQKGRVQMGVGNEGANRMSAWSRTTGQWELIRGCNIIHPANQLFIASASEGAEFYVDFAEVKSADPSWRPATSDARKPF